MNNANTFSAEGETADFLAVDTSSKYLTVLASKNGRFYSSYLPDCSMRHSVILMGEIDKVLKEADMSLSDCDFFAVTVGAGSFTGIRIGISTIKGFSLACKKPVLSVTSFEEAAYNGLNGEKTLCLADALHGYYYCAGYEKTPNPQISDAPIVNAPVSSAQNPSVRLILPPAYLCESEVLRLISEEGYVPCSLEHVALSDPSVCVRTVSPIEGLKRAVAEKSRFGGWGEPQALYIRKSQAETERENGSALLPVR